jgi:hypothetical protein
MGGILVNSPELTLKMTGKEFDDGYNLFYLSKGISNLNNLIDKSYLTIEDKKKMTDRDREMLQVKAYNIRPGSFKADLLIQLATVGGSLLPLVSSMTPNDIWKLITESFTFLNIILSGNSKGETFSLQTAENSLINLVNGDGNTIINVHPDVLHMVRKSERNFEGLTRLISPQKGVENISIFEKANSEKGLFIGVEEKMNFENKRRLDPNPITFDGMIVKVDGEGFNGRLKVVNGNEDISEGEYQFEFLIKENTDKLRNSFMNVKKVHALKETVLNTSTLEQKIYKLKIIEAK